MMRWHQMILHMMLPESAMVVGHGPRALRNGVPHARIPILGGGVFLRVSTPGSRAGHAVSAVQPWSQAADLAPALFRRADRPARRTPLRSRNRAGTRCSDTCPRRRAADGARLPPAHATASSRARLCPPPPAGVRVRPARRRGRPGPPMLRSPPRTRTLKAECERVSRELASGSPSRPGADRRPWRPQRRLAYWPEALRLAARCFVPAAPDGAPLQIIDVRDLPSGCCNSSSAASAAASTRSADRRHRGGDRVAGTRRRQPARRPPDRARAGAGRRGERSAARRAGRRAVDRAAAVAAGERPRVRRFHVGQRRARSAHGCARSLDDIVRGVLAEPLPEPGDERLAGKLSRERRGGVAGDGAG